MSFPAFVMAASTALLISAASALQIEELKLSTSAISILQLLSPSFRLSTLLKTKYEEIALNFASVSIISWASCTTLPMKAFSCSVMGSAELTIELILQLAVSLKYALPIDRALIVFSILPTLVESKELPTASIRFSESDAGRPQYGHTPSISER